MLELSDLYADKPNGFITFKIGESSIENIIQSTFWGGVYAPT